MQAKYRYIYYFIVVGMDYNIKISACIGCYWEMYVKTMA